MVTQNPSLQEATCEYLTEQGVVLLVAVYAKADRSNMLPGEIRKAV